MMAGRPKPKGGAVNMVYLLMVPLVFVAGMIVGVVKILNEEI